MGKSELLALVFKKRQRKKLVNNSMTCVKYGGFHFFSHAKVFQAFADVLVTGK